LSAVSRFFYFMNNEFIKKLNIPKKPGCYFYLDETGKIIYIGKAADLRSRVSSYWRDSSDLSPVKKMMLEKVARVKWIEVDSEIEALLLEANLVKKNQPEFNILLRDDKRFCYIKIDIDDVWPRIHVTRQVDRTGRYFGPFTSTEAARETIAIIRRIWPYRSCATLPKRACLYYRLGRCPAPCEGRVGQDEYKKSLRDIIMFLGGEKAKLLKNYMLRIVVLEKKLAKQKDLDDTAVPRELNRLQYIVKNINKVLEYSRILSLSDKYVADVRELAKILNLPRIPERIEGYDISNTSGKEAVGSMVVFKAGESQKNEYRKFKIKSDESLGDTGMLQEIIERRVKHDEWPKPDLVVIDGGKQQLNVVVRLFRKFEFDVLAVAISKGDGLRSAKAPDKIFFPGEKKPLILPLASPALHLVKRVRDEAHRFAIEYHRKLRGRKWRR